MTIEMFTSLVALAAAGAFTPGPNNAMVATSGATFGLRRTLPHIAGIALGFPLMVFLVGFFLAGLFQQSALLREGLRWLGAAILLWIAWKTATAGGAATTGGRPRPLQFIEAAGFQWINPKAWAMAVAITSQFVRGEAPLASAATVASVFIAIGILSAGTWTIAGQQIGRFLTSPARRTAFNWVMAALIAGCVVLLLVE